jgi:phage tail sheath protein FI
MPVAPTYPGVYIEEIPSGVRSITGVATSITAFVGRARRGPTDVDGPVLVDGYPDFVRTFGGLWVDSPMTYAVRDFFLNGGAQAIIVRIYLPTNPGDVTEAEIDVPTGLTLTARYPGTWGNTLRARVDLNVRPLEPGEVANSLFNLYVRDDLTGLVEEFRNVSITDGHPRRVDKVLANQSTLVTAAKPTGLPTAHDAPTPTKKLWDDNTTNTKVTTAVPDDGKPLTWTQITQDASLAPAKQGLYALERADLFNILCIPPHTLDPDSGLAGVLETGLVGDAAAYCESRRAVFVVDPPWDTKANATTNGADLVTNTGTNSRNAALFFPRLIQPNSERDNQLEPFAPCGVVAGIMARTDATRGVWKAPAGLDAALVGVPALEVPLTDTENGDLNPLGVNCLRVMPAAGPVVWGSRTMQGSDRLASDWKYLPVRRTALFLEESLYRGTQWVVFEPNDEPLWAQIRLNVGSFMHDLFRQGAFQGLTPKDAYFVKCDRETTTQSDINSGIVNIVVGFAPLKPAEFVVIQLQQMAGQIAV